MKKRLSEHELSDRLSDEQRNFYLDAVRSDASIIIEYLENDKKERLTKEKYDRRIITGTFIVASLTLIAAVVMLIK